MDSNPSNSNNAQAQSTDWALVRSFYLTCRSYKQTAEHFGINPDTIKKRCQRENWKSRGHRGQSEGTTEGTNAVPLSPENGNVSPDEGTNSVPLSPENSENVPYLVAKDGGRLPSLYDTSYLQKKDKYSAFLGGNKALVRVTWNDTPRETLLIVKDSYAHSLAPFLARHFDLLLVDLRYFDGSVSELIEQEGVKKVLFLYNVANLCDDTSLATIR